MAQSRAWQLESLAARYRGRARNVRLYIEELERLGPAPPKAAWKGPSWRWTPRLAGAAAAALLLLASPLGWRAWRDRSAPVALLPAPLQEPVGLSVGNGALVSYDAARGLLVRLDPDGKGVKGSERVDAEAVGAFAWTGEGVWTADPRTGTIRRHGDGPGLPVAAVFHEPYQRPRALAAARDALYVLDAASRCINEYERGHSLKLRRRYPLEGFVAGAIAVHNRDFWVVDEPGRVLRKYVAGEDESWMLRGSWSLDALAPAHGPAAGLAVDGRDLWLLTRAPVELRRVRLASLGGR